MKRNIIILIALAISLTLVMGVTVSKATGEEKKSNLSIKQAGLGTGVENRSLIDAGNTFEEGSKIYFLTWVVGGKTGDSVNHVWIHQEEEKFRIELNVDGPSWRTWSSKTLYPGSAGNWIVEAHDKFGKLLYSIPFKCKGKISQK